jgi:hypothetical protein
MIQNNSWLNFGVSVTHFALIASQYNPVNKYFILKGESEVDYQESSLVIHQYILLCENVFEKTFGFQHFLNISINNNFFFQTITVFNKSIRMPNQ